MNIQEYLNFQESQLEVPAGVNLSKVDLSAYKAASVMDQVIMLAGAGVKGKAFKAQLDAELGLTQAAGGDPGARQRFDATAGQSSLDLQPGAIFKKATKWIGPNLAGVPQLVATSCQKGAPHIQNAGLQMALGMYPSAFKNGGNIAFGATGRQLNILPPQLRSEIVTAVMDLWQVNGMDVLLEEAAKYRRHQDVAAAIAGARADTINFSSPQEILSLCTTAIDRISKLVKGSFNEGLAALLGQEFELLLLPALEDVRFVSFGVGITVLNGNALETLLNTSGQEKIRWSTLLADKMGDAVEALFTLKEGMDVQEYIMKLGEVGVQYSTALKRFLSVTDRTQRFTDTDIVTLSTAQPMLQAVNQQQLVNTGSITAGERGIAVGNARNSQFITGNGNNVETKNFTMFDQPGQQLGPGASQSNVAGDLNVLGDYAGRDINYNGDVIQGDKVGGDKISGPTWEEIQAAKALRKALLAQRRGW